ncbi:MAG: gamma-glutamyl-gamma-aminobutyrate hydrolase family protein, partial [Acidobacteria bacterium]|nr:gamma-glutamyl-gamma-aminobutyrate hydrolase family protein [Acidobacteriota bacterium]
MVLPVSDKPLIGLTCRWEETNDGFYLSRDYFLAVAAAGGIPVQIPLLPEVIPELAARLDGFVLCGSPSDLDPVRYGETCQPEVSRIHPDRDETDRRVLEHAFGEKKPVLGICFGLQSLNVHLGGTLI